MMKYVIDGKFLTQRMAGVQRVEIELIQALDRLVPNNLFEILCPYNADVSLLDSLQHIKIKKYGNLKGNAWHQIEYPYYLIKNGFTGINMGNVAPLIKPDIVFIHDMNIIRHKKEFSFLYYLWSRIQYTNSAKRAKHILTNSKFSRNEILSCYSYIKSNISILSLGWQHMKDRKESFEILKKLNLEKYTYSFSLFQAQPNKNFKWIIEIAYRNPQIHFVISGWHNKKTAVMGDEKDVILKMKNVSLTGYLSDEEIVSLIKYCGWFLYPSTYEGFGLPPLEALALGVARVCVGDIPVMHEVFENAVNYVDPYSYNVDLEKIPVVNESYRKKILDKYSWEKGARKLYEALQRELDL